MEFKVGQRFRVPNITWTITAIIVNYVVAFDIVYEDGSKPMEQRRHRVDEFRAVIQLARDLGRLLEDPVTVEE